VHTVATCRSGASAKTASANRRGEQRSENPTPRDGPVGEHREFWRNVLAEGGVTAIPRWSEAGKRGVAEHDAVISPDVAAGLERLAAEAGVPLSSVALAAHVKVLAALSGHSDVVTGYGVGDGRALPCRVPAQPDTWRGLVVAAARAEAALLAHRDFPVERLRRELEVRGPQFEAVLDATSPRAPGPAASRHHLGDGTVLRVGLSRSGRGIALRLRYRTEALDAAAAARIGGYYRRALELIEHDPDAAHTAQSLLSQEEMRLQRDGLAGPRRPLPCRPFHELYEEEVRRHPETVAAVHGEQVWSYRRLNAHANRLARAIRARGVRREGVVAVVTERNLDWMAAVIAIFKAGAVYLPVEPRLPAERIAAMLSRAECTLVLSEPGSTETLDQALARLPGVGRLLIGDAYREGHDDSDLGVPVEVGQPAYIYFTSGSTGEPKGAMCEHAGMLNHLFAKIADLGIRTGRVVAQTAPQCFDISLWQLVAALLAGGRTLLVEQEVILDVPRLLDRIVAGRAGVLQLVPSYLDAVVSCLEQRPRDLPDLTVVSVTGEALKPELVRRWFAVQPRVPLVNAYGLTETSDDTNHEIMTSAPDRVLLGRCVANVRVCVVDEHLSPVPLGAPGLIAFSGVCVGRGYVNDPERTRAAFLPDPHHEGEILYLGGDYGRWHPGGKLEFLGRRDNQVKIRGFRIEIGEIENTLLTVPGVRDAAVVTSSAGANAQLVAFYSGPGPLPASRLRDRLLATLPGYMIPAAFHWQATLPTTATGKVDRKTLTRLAGRLETTEETGRPPTTPTEHRLAAAWADVLGVPASEISPRDDFFDRGGTSLTAVKLAIALDRAISLADLARYPVLADLAAFIDGSGDAGNTSPAAAGPAAVAQEN
jgi:amino acid adenylation domain-containing protein